MKKYFTPVMDITEVSFESLLTTVSGFGEVLDWDAVEVFDSNL